MTITNKKMPTFAVYTEDRLVSHTYRAEELVIVEEIPYREGE